VAYWQSSKLCSRSRKILLPSPIRIRTSARRHGHSSKLK
jgi:hypothetical protein